MGGRYHLRPYSSLNYLTPMRFLKQQNANRSQTLDGRFVGLLLSENIRTIF